MIKKFKDYNKLNEDDSFNENEDISSYIESSINKLLDRCLHDVEKDTLKDYICNYIDNSDIVKSKNGWGFYGSNTNDSDDDSI